MEAEAVKKVEGEEAQLENKFALIVVGRMGHGKSSFCKMVVNDTEKPKVEAHVSIKSGTLDCKIYLSNRFHDVFGEDILIIDTPGLDSKNTASLITEDIDDLIVKHKLQIAGIAYVIDIMQREQDQQESSYIFAFLDFLRIKYCYKINLTFCVLSKYDKYYYDEETMQELMQQLSELFESNGYGKMWERHIQWMSQPVKDKKMFQKKKNGILKEDFKNQYAKLNVILKTIVEEGQFLSSKAYEKERSQFETLFNNTLVKDYGTFEYQNEINQLELTITIAEKGFFQSLFLDIVGSTFSHLMQPTAVQISSATMNQRLQKSLKNFLISSIAETIKIRGNTFTFNQLPYVTNIQCFDKNNRSIQVRKIVRDNYCSFRSQLRSGNNRIKFFCRLPTNYFFNEFLRNISRKFYNQ